MFFLAALLRRELVGAIACRLEKQVIFEHCGQTQLRSSEALIQHSARRLCQAVHHDTGRCCSLQEPAHWCVHGTFSLPVGALKIVLTCATTIRALQ